MAPHEHLQGPPPSFHQSHSYGRYHNFMDHGAPPRPYSTFVQSHHHSSNVSSPEHQMAIASQNTVMQASQPPPWIGLYEQIPSGRERSWLGRLEINIKVSTSDPKVSVDVTSEKEQTPETNVNSSNLDVHEQSSEPKKYICDDTEAEIPQDSLAQEPLVASQLPYQEPQHVRDHASDQEDLISEEPAAEHNTNLTMELETRVSEQTDSVTAQEQDVIEDGVQIEGTSASNRQKRKRQDADDSIPDVNVPDAKRAKTEGFFVIFGLPSAKHTKDNKAAVQFLHKHGYKVEEHAIQTNASILSRMPIPKYITNFTVLTSSTETELIGCLNDDATTFRIFTENHKSFGSEVSRYCILAMCSSIGELRTLQFLFKLMENFSSLIKFNTFRTISKKDYPVIKRILETTPTLVLQQSLKSFSIQGREEITHSFIKLIPMDGSFWIAVQKYKMVDE